MTANDEFRPSNPTTRYYDWSQIEKSFTYWDAEANPPARVPVTLPFKFLSVRERVVIMGFTEDENKDRIFSNEVRERDLGRQQFNVRTKSDQIARGYWRDIKDLVKQQGGNYCKIIHAIAAKGDLVCIRIKGNGLACWNNTVGGRNTEERRGDEFVQAYTYEETEYNNETYSYPVFQFAGSLTATQHEKVEILKAKLFRYYNYLEQEQLAHQNNAPARPVSQPAQQSAPRPVQPARMPEAPFSVSPSDNDDDLPF